MDQLRSAASGAAVAMNASRRSLLRGVALGTAVALGGIARDATGAPTRLQGSGGVTPVGVRIPRAIVDAPLEPGQIPGGVMDDPTGVWAAIWYEESSLLGVPGNVLLYGYPDWWGVGPAVFYFLQFLREGAQVDLVGDDGMAYRFRVASVAVLPPAEAIATLWPSDETREWATLFTAAQPFDEETQEYLNLVVVRAERTDDPPRPVDPRAFDAEDALGCAAVALPDLAASPGEPSASSSATPAEDTPGPTGFQTIEEIDATFEQSEPAPREVVDAIEAQLEAMTSCRLSLRRALVLADGRVVALVGPPGDFPLDAVTGLLNPEAAPDFPGAYLCGFFVFTDQGDQWRIERF